MGKKAFMGILLVLSGLFLTFLFGGCSSGDSSDIVVREDSTKRGNVQEDSGSKYTIYLITMDQGSNYWQQIDAGCKQAVKELGGIRYRWLAPENHSDIEQAECVDKAVADGADAILVAAISPTGINESLARASAAGVKLVYVDNAATQEALATLITDNEAAGKTAARTMLKALGEAGITSGTIGLGANNVAMGGILRDRGFREVFAETGFTVAPTVSMNGNRQNIKNHAIEHPEYVAFFGAHEQITRAYTEQIHAIGGKQIIVGFDTSDFVLSMIKDGVIYATMQQKPKQMGYDGVGIALRALKGEYTDTNTVKDMGITVITRDKI